MNRIRWCYATVAFLALTACQPRQQSDVATSSAARASDEAAIAQVLQRELAAARANNADSVALVLSSDATVKPPNEPPVTGAAWSQNMFRNVTVNQITYDDEQITVSGDMAVHTFGFDWTVTPKGGQAMHEKGHGIHVLQRQADGSWRITYDTWSADSPPPTGRGGD